MADDVPAFDDIPSFDEMPDAAAPPSGSRNAAQSSAIPAFDDIPSFDDMPDQHEAPKPEGPLMTGVREFAHNVIPGIAGTVAAGAGAVLGTPIPVAGPIVGGAAGFIAGSTAAEALQDKLLSGTPLDDSEQRAVNREVNHKSALAGELGGAMIGMSPGRVAESLGREVAIRAGAGAAQAGFGAASTKLQGGDLDPADLAIQFAAGAVAPGVNRLGAKLQAAGEHFVPGRPGRTANPAADQSHVDVGDDTVETAVGDSALAESPPRPTGETVGTPPGNQPTNSRGEVATGQADGTYAKTQPTAADQSQMSTGDISPDVQSALTAANEPEPPVQQAAPEPPVAPPATPPAQIAAQANAQKPKLSLRRPQEEPVVNTGIPEAGEPVAMGENDVTPMPAGTPERAAKAIARSTAAQEAPPITGETPINASITPAQREAGNYPKARTHDFGKPIAIETHAGDVRQGKGWEHQLPYDYGYFNKTKGPDGDHIDFIRPADGAPERGDKHYIIDQKNPETGKYDEPKVMTYVKDETTARDLYNRGFGDGRGPDRLHDITEVDRGQLVKFLAKHTTKPPSAPYGKPIPKTVKDSAVVKDLVQKLEAQGKSDEAAKLLAAPEEQVAAAIEGKRTRKYGVKGGYPVEGLVNDIGEPVTAKDKKLAAARTTAHKAVVDWFNKTAPKDTTSETNGQLLDRLKGHPYPAPGEWAPTFKPKEWMLAREAKKLLARPTEGNIQKFRDAERLLRGSPEAVDTYRSGNRVEGDIARSRRSGDEAVSAAENEAHQPGVNTEEDKIIASIDRAKAGHFKGDIPHEEAEEMVKPRKITKASDIKETPRKEVDVRESTLAQKASKPVAKMSLKELTEVKPEATKKEEFKPAEAASTGKSVKDKFSPEAMKRLVELSNQAAARKGLTDEEIGRMNFLRDESGAVGGQANAARGADIRDFLRRLLATTPVKSYIARTPNAKLEPHAEYTRGLSDELHVVSQLDKLHRQELLKKSAELNKTTDRDALERIYTAREADSARVDLPNKQAGKSNIESLSPADKKVYDEHLKDVFDQNDQFYDAIAALPNGADRLGPKVENHVARITKGDTSEYNMLKDRDDPTGPQYNGLSVSASMQNERPFAVLERTSDGKRFVVQKRDGGFTLWDKYKGTRLKDPNFEFEANKPYSVTGKNGKVDYVMREAMSREIEQNARGRDGKGKPMKYYKNAGLSAYMTNAQMGSMARHLQELARISSTPEFAKLTTRSAEDARKKGFIETKLPNFKGTYMDPQLAHVMDDYAKPGFDTPEMLRNLSQSVTKLLFWMPTAHIANVGAHWFVGRGFDNLNAKSLFETGTKAIKSVMAQDADQQRYMRAGAGLIYPSVQTRGFIEKVAKGVGEEMVKDPSKWGPLADKIGVPLKALSDSIYKWSSHTMWAANDVFLTQRIMELERKGMSTDQAIHNAEKDIPNYRLPTTIMGAGQKARILQQVMADPTLTAFGRYHYGMFNSYANIIKDAIGKDASAGDRVEAVGKMMAMGVLAFGIYPAMDKLAQLVTGNDHAEQARRGPIAIPSHLVKAAQGKEDVMSAARSTLTLPPWFTTALETLFNKDWRGKSIVEPGDVAAGFKGNAYRGGKALVQEGEHAARGLVSPYGTFSTAEKKSNEPGAVGVAKSVGRAIRDQAIDVKNPSPNSVKFQQKQSIINEKNARLRERKGGYGPAEEAYKKAFGN